MRHLADPAQVLVDAINLLRPTSGLIIFDDFNIVFDTDSNDMRLNLFRLLSALGQPFFMLRDDGGRRMHVWALRRLSQSPLKMPFEYCNEMVEGSRGQADKLCKFKLNESGDVSPIRLTANFHFPVIGPHYATQSFSFSSPDGLAFY